MSALVLRRRAYDCNDAWALVTALHAEQLSVYRFADDPRDTPPRQFEPGAGLFLVGYLAGIPVACGGMRLLDHDTAEIKRMYTVAAYRGSGFGQEILAALELAAVRCGARRMFLETGARNAHALRLYESAGYQPIPPYVEHRNPLVNRAFAKPLADGSAATRPMRTAAAG